MWWFSEGSAVRSRTPMPACVGGGAGTSSGQGYPLAGACVSPGWWVLHTRVHSASVGTAESCGTAKSVAGAVLLPCAQAPSLHMGARPPHTTITRKACHSNKNQPPSCRDPTLPCATPTTTTPTRHTTPHTTNPPQTPTGTGPISVRNTTDLDTEMYRFRGGNGPISARSTTDLEK